MNKDYLQYNFVEVLNFQRDLKTREQQLVGDLDDVRARLKAVESIINRNDSGETNWLVLLPKEILSGKRYASEEKKEKVNWKYIVIKIITECDQPMTSEMLFFKAKILYDYLPDDRVHCISNISAALHYLVFNDNKLFRMKNAGSRSYVYGLHHFFDNAGKLKIDYLKKFEMEYSGR
jgi:hypothetical protein